MKETPICALYFLMSWHTRCSFMLVTQFFEKKRYYMYFYGITCYSVLFGSRTIVYAVEGVLILKVQMLSCAYI